VFWLQFCAGWARLQLRLGHPEVNVYGLPRVVEKSALDPRLQADLLSGHPWYPKIRDAAGDRV